MVSEKEHRLSSSLRASVEERGFGIVLAGAGLFQHPGDSLAHDVDDIIRQEMIPRTFDFLPDTIPADIINAGPT